MSQFQPWGLLLGRVFLAYIFILTAIDKMGGFAGNLKYMASKAVPMAEPLLAASIALELVGGLMLVVGWKTRWAAWALFAFVLIATVIFHNFWAVPQEQVMLQTILFRKNLAIMGGLLYVALLGAGRLSLDKS